MQWASELASSGCAEQLWIIEHLVARMNLTQQVWGQARVLLCRGSQGITEAARPSTEPALSSKAVEELRPV